MDAKFPWEDRSHLQYAFDNYNPHITIGKSFNFSQEPLESVLNKEIVVNSIYLAKRGEKRFRVIGKNSY
jgi:hypothetical protein